MTVTIGLAQQWSWSGANEPQFIAHIKKRGGIVLGYTTAVHPEHMTSYEDFIQPVVRREIAFGFLPSPHSPSPTRRVDKALIGSSSQRRSAATQAPFAGGAGFVVSGPTLLRARSPWRVRSRAAR